MEGHNILRPGQREGWVMSNYVVASSSAKQNYIEDQTQLKRWLLVGLWFKIKINVSKGGVFRERMETLHLYKTPQAHIFSGQQQHFLLSLAFFMQCAELNIIINGQFSLSNTNHHEKKNSECPS